MGGVTSVGVSTVLFHFLEKVAEPSKTRLRRSEKKFDFYPRKILNFWRFVMVGSPEICAPSPLPNNLPRHTATGRIELLPQFSRANPEQSDRQCPILLRYKSPHLFQQSSRLNGASPRICAAQDCSQSENLEIFKCSQSRCILKVL
jgi:hypothetical protein